LKRKERTFSELRHVREERRFHFTGEHLEFVRVLQGFGKNSVRACLKITAGALYCAIEIFNGARICARDDHEIFVATCADRCFDSSIHLINIDHRFAGKMSAALRKFLIFNVTTGQACLFQLADGAGDILRTTETSVRIDNCRNRHCICNIAGKPHDLRHR
jgi:hypothetical protein